MKIGVYGCYLMENVEDVVWKLCVEKLIVVMLIFFFKKSGQKMRVGWWELSIRCSRKVFFMREKQCKVSSHDICLNGERSFSFPIYIFSSSFLPLSFSFSSHSVTIYQLFYSKGRAWKDQSKVIEKEVAQFGYFLMSIEWCTCSSCLTFPLKKTC